MHEMLKEVADRLKGLRDIFGYSPEDMALVTETTPEEYLAYENGEKDFTFTFLYKVARKFGVDITDIMTGESPRLSSYSLVRAGQGFPIKRREGFRYQHMAYLFKNKLAEPFIVTAPFNANEDIHTVPLSSHEGQELNMVISGTLEVMINGHTEVLNAGDMVYYDATSKHGMIAKNGETCTFLSVVISPSK